MKVILLKDVKNLGKKYEIKEVADGHALNKLLPSGSVLIATLANINKIEAKKKSEGASFVKNEAMLQSILVTLKDVLIEISGKVNDKGHLFAGIHKEQILDELKKQKDINLLVDHLILEKPIKEVGEHSIVVNINNNKSSFTLKVKAE